MANARKFGTGMHCADFDALISDALDDSLGEAQSAAFHAHVSECQICGPMFAQVLAGMRLTKSLAVLDPPLSLVHNILAKTSEGAGDERVKATAGTAKRRSWLPASLRPVLSPRFAASFSMAFFSITLLLNVAGVKISDLRKLDLRPSNLKSQFDEATTRVIKYYDNLRVVYEFESKMRELKKASGSQSQDESAPEPKKQRKPDNTSDKENKRQDQNYSYELEQTVIASVQFWP